MANGRKDDSSLEEEREFIKKVYELMKARLDSKRSLDPSAELTPEEKAQAADEANAYMGYDTTIKTDPELFMKKTPEEEARSKRIWDDILKNNPKK